MANDVKRRRKKYFVLVRFQLKYILYILAFLYIGAAVGGYTVYYTTWLTLGEKLANVYPRGRLIYIFHNANMTLLFRVIMLTPVFVLIGTLLSHRIAGPVYRIGKYIESLMNGDYSQGLRLRKKDELKSLASKMTLLRNKLKEDDEKKQKMIAEVIDSLNKNQVSGNVVEEVETKLKQI